MTSRAPKSSRSGPTSTPGLLDVVVCPHCRGVLSTDGLRCDDCGRSYPRIDGIALLLAEPSARLDAWRGQVAEFERDNAGVRAKILAQLAGEQLLPRTRTRLRVLHEKLEEHRQRLVGLMADAGIEAAARSERPAPDVPGEGTITAYYHQIHRDWGWDDTESTEAVDMADAVAEVIGGRPLGAMLVLGAGACRLPYDLHRRHGATLTVALDVNPLPFFVARRLLGGQSVRLFELPLRPRHSSRSCIDRNLRCVDANPSGFELVFADGLDPPVRPGAFDTVFTPWFIDQIPTDAAKLMPVLHEVLRSGGRWINFGPLVYHPSHTRLAHRYCVDEIVELAQSWGFEVESSIYRRMHYMESPDGTQGRTEFLLVSSMRKTDARPAALEGSPSHAPWLDDPRLPVPRFEGLDDYRAPHPMFAAVVELVDGARTTEEIASILVQRHGLPADAAAGGVQTCLREIYRALESGS